MKLVIEIPGLPPREIRGNYHPRTRAMAEARRRESTAWRTTAHYAIVDARNRAYLASRANESYYDSPACWKNLDRVTITVPYVLGNKRRIDTDNLEGQAMKPVWDAMVHCNLISDDRWQVIHKRTYQAEIDKGKGPMTIVEVEA